MDPEQRRAAAAAACRAYVKRKTRFGRSLIATMALVCLGMSMVALDSAGLLVGGKHAIAQVLRVGPGECPERSTGCEDRTASIRFSADARDVRTNVSVPKPGPETGTRLEIVYRRGDPREASLPGSLQRDLVRGGVIAVLAALGALGGILWIRGARRRAARLHTLMLEGAPRPAQMTGFGIWTVAVRDATTGENRLVKTYVRVKRSPPLPVQLIGAMTDDASFVIETDDQFLIPAGYPSED
jgi:hypothetical protein